jgi:hypothetical protein
MSQVSGQGTIWNLPNYWGELFTADLVNTPFLSMIGGLSGGGMQTDNFEFATSSEYDFPAAAQPAITETASLTAPTSTSAMSSCLTLAAYLESTLRGNRTTLPMKRPSRSITTCRSSLAILNTPFSMVLIKLQQMPVSQIKPAVCWQLAI